MRVVFGVVSLLIVLAVVGWTARAGLRGVARPPSAAAPVAASAVTVSPQQRVQRDIDAALRQGRARNDAAERQEAGPADPAVRPATAGGAP